MEGLRELRIRGSRAGRMEYQRQIHRQEATKQDFSFFSFSTGRPTGAPLPPRYLLNEKKRVNGRRRKYFSRQKEIIALYIPGRGVGRRRGGEEEVKIRN